MSNWWGALMVAALLAYGYLAHSVGYGRGLKDAPAYVQMREASAALDRKAAAEAMAANPEGAMCGKILDVVMEAADSGELFGPPVEPASPHD